MALKNKTYLFFNERVRAKEKTVSCVGSRYPFLLPCIVLLSQEIQYPNICLYISTSDIFSKFRESESEKENGLNDKLKFNQFLPTMKQTSTYDVFGINYAKRIEQLVKRLQKMAYFCKCVRKLALRFALVNLIPNEKKNCLSPLSHVPRNLD